MAADGQAEELQRCVKNIGSEALSAWIYQQASKPNPFDLLGAMFIIEGLGKSFARRSIELYTPMYGLLLSDHDFWRASNSLQLDETVAIYIGKLLGEPMALSLVNNRHPMVPIITLQAGYRLMLHGLNAEILHGYLCECKRRAAAPTA